MHATQQNYHETRTVGKGLTKLSKECSETFRLTIRTKETSAGLKLKSLVLATNQYYQGLTIVISMRKDHNCCTSVSVAVKF